MNILVTDGEQRAALALVRSFGRAGFRPFVVSTRGPCIAAASRWTAASAGTPDPLDDPQAFTAVVRGLIAEWRIDMVIPTSEAALLCLLPQREELHPAIIPFPDVDAFRRICDKQAVLEAAQMVGIAAPAQTVVATAADARRLDMDALSFPVVLKPSRSVGEWEGARVKLGVSYAASRAELEQQIGRLPPAAFPLLLQQMIVGAGIGVFLLTWHDDALATFSHRRLREKPPSGGVSVYRESTVADPMLVDMSRALLKRLDWSGVAMVEFKIDTSTGTPYLMEINGRFWGSLQLAVDAGVDFPVLLARAAAGEAVRPVTSYRVGVRSRWWWGDVDHLIAVLRRRRSPATPVNGVNRLRSCLDFVKLAPGDINEIFRWSDPAPFYRETLDWLARR